MFRIRSRRAQLVLALAAVTTFVAASLAHAGGSAEARNHLGLKRTMAHSNAVGGIGPCLDNDQVVGVGPVSSVCFRTGNAGANVGYASSTAGPGRSTKVVSFIKGAASSDLGVSAVGDTAVCDSIQIQGVSAAGQITLQIRGRIYVESAAAGRNSGLTRTINLYPDSVAANADPTGAGAGASFHGKIVVQSTAGSPPVAIFSGALSASDFNVQTGPGNRLTISTSSLDKIVGSVADTAVAVLKTSSSTESAPVPMAAPLAIGAIAAMLGGTAFLAIRRRARVDA